MKAPGSAGASDEHPSAEAIEVHLRALAVEIRRRLDGVIGSSQALSVSTKAGAYDLVTEADRAMEDWLFDTTHRAFPEHGFLGEERGWRIGPTRSTDWIVDPIDGTVNFVSGIPWSCCSVGMLQDGVATAGLIVDASRRETYLTVSAEGGTELNDVAVRVASGGDLAGKVVFLEVPGGTMPSALRVVEDFVRDRDGAVRFMGSGALAMAMVAAGRAHAIVHLRPNSWDVAAGVALVVNAGGVAVGPNGPYDLLADTGPLVCGSEAACAELEPLLKRFAS